MLNFGIGITEHKQFWIEGLNSGGKIDEHAALKSILNLASMEVYSVENVLKGIWVELRNPIHKLCNFMSVDCNVYLWHEK